MDEATSLQSAFSRSIHSVVHGLVFQSLELGSLVSLLSSIDCSPVIVSKEWTGVDVMAPVMILEA